MKVEVVQIEAGHEREYRGHHRGQLMKARVGRVWDVLIDGEVVGEVRFDMRTRETKSYGRTYVNSRWESPGWTWRMKELGWGRGLERSSKKQCVAAIVNNYERHLEEGQR